MGDVRFQQLDDFLLLPTRESRHIVKELSEFAGWRPDPFPTRRVAEQFFNGDPEGSRHGDQHVRPRQRAAGLPVADIGLLLRNESGEFPL